MNGKMYERFGLLQAESSKEDKESLDLIDDLGWDYDRMSSSGQETYDKICLKLGIFKEDE